MKQQRFTYLTNERLSITSMSGLAAQHYGYANGNLSTLSRKSRVGTGAFTWQSYHFAYAEATMLRADGLYILNAVSTCKEMIAQIVPTEELYKGENE